MKGKNKKIILQRVGKKFALELKEIQGIRKAGIDLKLPRPIGSERLTEKIVEYPEWETIKNKLKKEPRKEDLIGLI
jgi:hypothetical protein